MKTLQRRVLAEVLERVPVHAAVHGFVRGRSIQTFAATHVAQAVVLRMDLREFFASIPAARGCESLPDGWVSGPGGGLAGGIMYERGAGFGLAGDEGGCA